VVITLGPELESALNDAAAKQGIAPEVLAVNILRKRFLAAATLQPRDDWERLLLSAASDCGVSLTNEQLSREVMYD
jgi:hypothetical protein